MLPFASGDVLNGESFGVGLCTLWTPKEKYLKQLPRVQVIGNLYTHFGIGFLVRNVLATPEIKNIVITGIDNPEPKQRQAQALLGQELEPEDLFLESYHIEEFFRRTNIVDGRQISVRDQASLADLVASLTDRADKHLAKPIIVPMPEVSQDRYPSHRSGHLIRASSIRQAHADVLREVRLFGDFTQPDSEGHIRQELWQLTVCLSANTSFLDNPLYEDDEILRYGQALWDGDEPEELTYRYGHTLRHRYGDQIGAALVAFKKKPETFRTVLSLWEPLESMLRDDEPCLVTIHPRVRNGSLDMFAYIRTNEMFRGWPKNAAGLRYFQERFAGELSVACGELTITSGSAHLYDRDLPAVDKMLSQLNNRRIIEFDPKGDWNFTKDGEQFVAEHSIDGTLLQRFIEPNIVRLEKRILPFVGSISHAVYIGRELARLEQR